MATPWLYIINNMCVESGSRCAIITTNYTMPSTFPSSARRIWLA